MRAAPSSSRRTRAAITLAVCSALCAPVVLDRDSFPLSTYPMYARARSTQSTITTAWGVSAGGEVVGLTPALIGDSDDPLLVVGELRAALDAGRGDVRCAEIADRVARRTALVGVERVEIVSERHDTLARTRGQPSLLHREVRAACTVKHP